jgi:hypothetical protein
MPHWAGSGRVTHTHTQRVRGQRRLEGGVAAMKLRPAMEKLFSKEFHQKAQSAMEYLMTYGWAILIIAVVLGALFQLGIFNANNFAPKAPPGACQVFRPNGPYTTSFINLEGVCSGELPQYVATLSGSSQYISVPNYLLPSAITFTAWVNSPSWSGGDLLGQNGCGTNYPYFVRIFTGGQVNLGYQCLNGMTFSTSLSTNAWHFIAVTISGGSATLFVDGTSYQGTMTYSTTFTRQELRIGDGSDGYFEGSTANVQIYNTTLSANEIQALYLEGIGGAPIDLQNLISWWPLNGNANDYSGNGNNGQAIGGVTYTSSWTSGYTPP